MRLIRKPIFTHEEILDSCTNNVADFSLKERVRAEKEFFRINSEEYNLKATSGELSKMPMHNSVNEVITVKEMKLLYGKLLTKGIPARDYYDRILHVSRMCPFCGCRPTKTLDHYLPKSKFPTFAVDPQNLVPCCRDCNSAKLTSVPIEAEEAVHPYYDNIDDERWLYARVEQVKEVGFKFYVVKPLDWSEEKFQKVKYHFITFELSDIYSVLASSELGEQAYKLQDLFKLGGPQIVKEQLLEYHESAKKPYLNSWKSAMFEALANSDWFCTEGIDNYSI